MKKILIFTLVAFAATMTMSAQKGDFSVGGQFNFASKNSMVGLGVNLEYEFIDNFRIEPEFIYYFENEGISAINANLNLHYLIKTGSNFVLYPMAGFSYARFDDNYWGGEDRFGANIGFGAEYRITNNFRFYTEERIQVLKDWNQSVTSLGVRYKF